MWAKALGPTPKGDGLRIETSDGKERSLGAEKILVTVGRAPVTADLGLEELVAAAGAVVGSRLVRTPPLALFGR